MKKNNNSQLVNSRWKSFIKPIFTFFVVAIPGILLWIFFSSDFPFANAYNMEYDWWIKLLIGIAFICGSFLITCLFVSIKIIDISIFMFSLPVSICFTIIFVSDSLVAWVRAIIIIPFFFLIIPISIAVKKIEIRQIMKSKNKINNDNNKIIGHKK